LKIKSKN